MASGHIEVKKGTSHVFYMATHGHAIESVGEPFPLIIRRPCNQDTLLSVAAEWYLDHMSEAEYFFVLLLHLYL